MKRIMVTGIGTPKDTLVVSDVPEPHPKAGEACGDVGDPDSSS